MTRPKSNDFAHLRLDAYHLAQDLIVEVVRLTGDLPRGFAEIRDQARRSALATVRHIAEGASHFSNRDKGARFIVARGEVAELDATLESGRRLELFDPATGRRVQAKCQRVASMLTGLIRQYRELGR